MATAHPIPTEPRFDPEYYQVPETVRLSSFYAEFARAQMAIDHLRKERGEARSLAARYEQSAHGLADRCRRAESELASIQAERLAHWREVKAQARDAAAAEVKGLVERLRAQVALIEAEAADYRSQLCEVLAGDAGEDCKECGGTGEVVDEIPDEFGTQRHRGGCTECFDGRVAK